MRTHTQLKKLLAKVLMSLSALTVLAQVTGAGQSAKPAVVAGRPDGSASEQMKGLQQPYPRNSERVAVRPLRNKKLAVGGIDPSTVLFQPAVTYSSGVFPLSVAVADLNGDGKPDLVVANDFPSKVSVLLGNGDGTFQAAVAYAPGGSFPISVAVADLNGDGKPDVVVANECADSIACSGSGESGVGVLLGNGDGTFQTAVTYRSGGTFIQSVAIADVNGDGKPDVLVANSCAFIIAAKCLVTFNGSVGVLLGSGGGNFAPVRTYDSGGQEANSIVVGDLNGDGKPDLVVANILGERSGVSLVGVLLGRGDGTFKKVVTYSVNSGAYSVAVADLNGDGKLDVVVTGSLTNTDGVAAVLLGNGDGTLQPAVTYNSGGQLNTISGSMIAVADVDGDGKADLLMVNPGSGTVGALLGNGDGTFQAPLTYASGGSEPISVAVADVNGDAKPDLLVVNSSSDTVGVLLNNTGVRNSTSTSLASSLNPSTYGQAVTWTATVTSSGSGTPTGKVTFTWGNTIGTAMLNASGVATLTKSNLNADTFPLAAVYSGDAANLGSTSAVLNQVVTQTSSAATLTSSPNPSTQGQAVTFTATITSPTVTAKGPVTFTAEKTVLGTAQLSSGHARLMISSLPVGSTKITATYYGDSNIEKSSASVTQTVH